MEKAREFLELSSEKESESVSRLTIHPHRVGHEPSFYEDFALRGIRVDRVEPGLVSCTFKVPRRLTVRLSQLSTLNPLIYMFVNNWKSVCYVMHLYVYILLEYWIIQELNYDLRIRICLFFLCGSETRLLKTIICTNFGLNFHWFCLISNCPKA